MAKQLKITQVRSIIDYPKRQRRTLEALGLRRIGHVVVHQDTPPDPWHDRKSASPGARGRSRSGLSL